MAEAGSTQDERINHSKLELVVRVRSFFSLPDGGPKTWWQGRTLPTKVVDTNSFGLLQLVNFIAEHCMWGSKQYITLWRDLEYDSVEIKSDENLLEWFLTNVESGLVCINAQINDFEGPIQFSPTKRRFHPTVRAGLLLNEQATTERAKNATPTSPSKKKTTCTKKKTAATKKSASEGDAEVLSDSSYDFDLAASSDFDDEWSSGSDNEFDPNGEIVDEEDEYDLPMFSYDADDPCIDVNVVFPDVNQCKLAVTHHAILHDHAFETLKKDTTRFRAICKRADQGYKWNFFASTSKGVSRGQQ